ncbi:hypothetical protein G5V59_10860 [Nocardioides sp. W3-2-3]|uniref:endonuclease/exonuclease/phosphatase family protein n=1 Tax=Nocardioides convexus TaxID=2712224 RepID=UPI002418507C|nr:endonuclease/exonuclease/phosphatase family protein [Nocardioides convexus]NHA00405.1 hypothetical protein [Nocardioides convexus]
MRIATWNVNSLRSRIDRVEAFLERHDVDVLAVQETKAREDQAAPDGPAGARVRRRGPRPRPVERRRADQPGRAGRRRGRLPRAARLGRPRGGGGAGPRRDLRRDPDLEPLRAQRPQARRPALRLQSLDWLSRLSEASSAWLDTPTALVGDWNICPTDDDVFDVAQFKSLHPRHPRRAGRLPALPRRGLGRGDPRARAGLHVLGLLPAALRARPRAQDRLRPRLGRARRAGHRRLRRPRGAGREGRLRPRAGRRGPGRLEGPACAGAARGPGRLCRR